MRSPYQDQQVERLMTRGSFGSGWQSSTDGVVRPAEAMIEKAWRQEEHIVVLGRSGEELS
jgi:hypothetical protein